MSNEEIENRRHQSINGAPTEGAGTLAEIVKFSPPTSDREVPVQIAGDAIAILVARRAGQDLRERMQDERRDGSGQTSLTEEAFLKFAERYGLSRDDAKSVLRTLLPKPVEQLEDMTRFGVVIPQGRCDTEMRKIFREKIKLAYQDRAPVVNLEFNPSRDDNEVSGSIVNPLLEVYAWTSNPRPPIRLFGKWGIKRAPRETKRKLAAANFFRGEIRISYFDHSFLAICGDNLTAALEESRKKYTPSYPDIKMNLEYHGTELEALSLRV